MTTPREDYGKMAANGPVFFLVQQQAKAIVSIQELQSRMTLLEGLQGRLMQAIKDIRQHLVTPARTRSAGGPAPSVRAKAAKSGQQKNKSASAYETKESASSKTSSSEEDEVWNPPAKNIAKDVASKSDSYNKDSGIGGDSSILDDDDDEDELLHLLDIIDQKSLVLLQQVGQQNASMASSDLDHVLFEKVESHRQLCEVKAERDQLKQRLAELEMATEAVLKEKRRVQQSLDSALSENQSLQMKMHKSLVDTRTGSNKLGYMEDIEKANVKKKYLQYSEKSRRRVSSVLKETNVLELQKQLLTYIMENDVLRAKLEQDEPQRLANWLRVEARLKEELKEAKDEIESFHQVIEMKDSEIASWKKRVASMEEAMENETCIKNFGLGSADDWREPGVQNNPYNKTTHLNAASKYSPLGYGDFSKTQSLPAMLLTDSKQQSNQQHQQQYGLIFDTGSSFTDVPLDYSLDSCAPRETRDLVDLTHNEVEDSSTYSTLVQQSHYLAKPSGLSSTPNLAGSSHLQNWELRHKVAGAKLVNGHLCWKGMTKDISSICTEFDPLSETPSCENFVDSLNLSIPLKPTQVLLSSQLSSMGDSLHSASLDLGCATAAPASDSRTKNMQNARSVDGIRELLVDKVYGKSRAQYRPHAMSCDRTAKSGRVTLTNCLHESSDYSLL